MSKNNPDHWYSERDISTTFVKGLKVLAAFEGGAAHLTLPEIGSITGYDRATIRRLVITLVDEGLLIKKEKSFSLTPKILTLSGGYLRSHSIGAIVQPILNKYSEKLGNEISIATLIEGNAIYLARSNFMGSAVSFGFTVGSRLPLLPTAVGRMLLALKEKTTLRETIDAYGLIQYTPQTNMNAESIQQEVAKARNDGFAVVHAEFEAGISGIVVPVGSIRTAKTVIGVSGATAIFRDANMLEVCLSTLQLCARELDRAWLDGA